MLTRLELGRPVVAEGSPLLPMDGRGRLSGRQQGGGLAVTMFIDGERDLPGTEPALAGNLGVRRSAHRAHTFVHLPEPVLYSRGGSLAAHVGDGADFASEADPGGPAVIRGLKNGGSPGTLHRDVGCRTQHDIEHGQAIRSDGRRRNALRATTSC